MVGPDRTGQVNAGADDTTDRRTGGTYSGGTLTADRGWLDAGQTTTWPGEATSFAAAPRAGALATPPASARVIEPATATEPFAMDHSVAIGVSHARPRSSALATLALLVGVLGAVAVATGELAGPGAGLGLVAALLAFGGIAATGSRRVVGKADSVLGLVLGLASLVFGVIALSGRFGWLNTHTNLIADLHQWLQLHASWTLRS
jgi:hypothetical protein